MSLCLILDSADAKDVKAKFSFSLLDKNGVPVPSFSCTTAENTFKTKGFGWGVGNFIKQEDLEGSAHLIGDISGSGAMSPL